MLSPTLIAERHESERVAALRRRVRDAMELPPVRWDCPARIDAKHMGDPLPVRKARAIALKLGAIPADIWFNQIIAGSMTLESPRVHAEQGLPDYTTDAERTEAAAKGMSIHSVFGHIVPDYPTLLTKGLRGIRADAEAQRAFAMGAGELAFLNAVEIAVDAVIDLANRIAARCEHDAQLRESWRATELQQMAENLRQAPANRPRTFWQALQAVWLVHLALHCTEDRNALGRADQYLWPFLEADLASGEITWERAAELVDCFTLKFNERASATDEQRAENRAGEEPDLTRRTRHGTSSQVGGNRDRLDSTNHWLQNIVLGGLTPAGDDATNPLTFLFLESYRRHQMTNPLFTVRLHSGSPSELVHHTADVLKDGGGMPALFNDEAIIPALERMGIPTPDARDYTNDGCWEVILPGRTDFRFQRLSLMLCLEWALNRGRGRLDGVQHGPETPDPHTFTSFNAVAQAFMVQLDAMVARTVKQVAENMDDRSQIAPVPLLSALTDGAIASRRDLTAGGAKYRTFALLAESAAYAIDSLTAIRSVIFERQEATMADLCHALKHDFEGHTVLRAKLQAAPKYGNDDTMADEVGRAVIDAFVRTVQRHGEQAKEIVKFPCGVGTFSWYIGIGEGLGASPDGRLSGEAVSSNFSPGLGRDMEGIPGAMLSYAAMPHSNLPAGGPLDLRLGRSLVQGAAGTERLAALLRTFVELGGAMMTLTVADTAELRAAQADPERYKSLRVRMGGWCAYFTMLSREQQEHHIRRQEGRL